MRDHIKSTMLSDITIPEDLEVLWIQVPCPSAAGSSIYICVVYHPPKDPRADVLFDHIVTTVDKIRSNDNKAVFMILGDFNAFDDAIYVITYRFAKLLHFQLMKTIVLTKLLRILKITMRNLKNTSPLGKVDTVWYYMYGSPWNRSVSRLQKK